MTLYHAKAVRPNEPELLVPFTAEEESIRVADIEAQVALEPQQKLTSLRTRRNTLLTECDWTQGSDTPLSDEVKTSWTTYRQSLRDLPANTPDPANPTWPDVPE